MLNMHPEEDIESKLINLYYRAFPVGLAKREVIY